MDNAGFGTIGRLEKIHYGWNFGTTFEADGKPYWADYAAMARSAGARGVIIKSAVELGPALKEALESGLANGDSGAQWKTRQRRLRATGRSMISSAKASRYLSQIIRYAYPVLLHPDFFARHNDCLVAATIVPAAAFQVAGPTGPPTLFAHAQSFIRDWILAQVIARRSRFQLQGCHGPCGASLRCFTWACFSCARPRPS